MKVFLSDTMGEGPAPAIIAGASLADMPLKKDGWQFNWRQLFRTPDSTCYRLSLERDGTTQGMLLLTLLYGEMLYMNNLEVAPHNLGGKGRFDRVAGCLIAFACRQSFLEAKGAYQGYLTFESKTELIGLYEERYGATRAMGQKMFIGPAAGRSLMEKYLIEN